eukprot:TRINITY_DN16455_c0_g1_i1.p1 TRINITY_DN16455_c0_g1~~TRINITY_DN16455_c0_g1_i1.p1  ORF type:complete len:340 (+),score=91.08 TRINITY_DN16455_c0_g1_i1:44-1063(+)
MCIRDRSTGSNFRNTSEERMKRLLLGLALLFVFVGCAGGKSQTLAEWEKDMKPASRKLLEWDRTRRDLTDDPYEEFYNYDDYEYGIYESEEDLFMDQEKLKPHLNVDLSEKQARRLRMRLAKNKLQNRLQNIAQILPTKKLSQADKAKLLSVLEILEDDYVKEIHETINGEIEAVVHTDEALTEEKAELEEQLEQELEDPSKEVEAGFTEDELEQVDSELAINKEEYDILRNERDELEKIEAEDQEIAETVVEEDNNLENDINEAPLSQEKQYAFDKFLGRLKMTQYGSIFKENGWDMERVLDGNAEDIDDIMELPEETANIFKKAMRGIQFLNRKNPR